MGLSSCSKPSSLPSSQPYRIGEFWSYPQSRPFAELLIVRVGPDAPGGAGYAIPGDHVAV
jgi:hypothetical protein